MLLRMSRHAIRSDVGIASLALALAATIVIPAAATTSAGALASARPAALVGRWERVNTCQELVRALRERGLGPTAPAMVAGNGYVPGTPKQLARKADICKGAIPRRHSHFFTSARQFGSLDWKASQVDEGSYRIVGVRTLRLGDGTFRYRILDGKKLTLTPLISAAARRKALAHPLQFSVAGWMVAVAFPGHIWKRVPCGGWC
jgi:hypothetical protein